MTRFKGEIGIGDVLVTREGNPLISGFIRLGAAIAGLPAKCNHVIVVHHKDDAGTWWGIEGRPGGVGWRDLTGPTKGVLTNANNQQPKTEEQRYLIAVAAEGALSTPYDWIAIGEHTREALSIWDKVRRVARMKDRHLIKEWNERGRPGHVVCSSLADWAYEQVGLDNPGGSRMTRLTTPGHWDQFIMDRKWAP